MHTQKSEAWTMFADAVSKLRRQFSQDLKMHDISLMEYRILARLDEKGPSQMARLADELLVTKAGITLLIDKLEGRGLVSRMRKKGDRRMIFTEITADGRRRCRKARKAYTALIDEAMGRLSEQELASLMSIVAKLGYSGKPEIGIPVK